MKKSILLVMIGLLSLTACKKNDGDGPDGNGNTSGKYLKKVNYWTVGTNKEVTIRELVVSATGDITALKTYTTNAQGGTSGNIILEFTSIEKNSAGKVTKISGQDKQQNKALEYLFSYDAAGNLTKCVLRQDGADYRTKNFTYDSSNRLTFENELANNNSDKVVREKTFTYTGSEVNPGKLVDDSKGYNIITYTLKFDDKKNPSQAAPAFLYPMNLIDVYKANVIESNNGTTTTKNTLTYNNDGFATSTTNGSGSGLKFEYGD